MKIWLARFGTMLAVIGGGAFLWYALPSVGIADLTPYATPRMVLALTWAALLYSLTVPLSAWAWRRLLTSLGCSCPLSTLTRILLTTQIGKYLPGNIGQHLGRIGMAVSEGISAPAVMASIVYETLLLLLAGVITGVTAGLLSSNGASAIASHGTTLALAIVIAAGGLLLIPMLGWLGPKLASRIKSYPAGLNMRLGAWAALSAFLAYVAAYISIGAGVSVLATTLFPTFQHDYALLVCAFSVAWVVGFVTPGAPAGIGIREGVLALILTPSLGPDRASILIIGLRVATTIGDILCLIAGLALAAYTRNSNRPAETATRENL